MGLRWGRSILWSQHIAAQLLRRHYLHLYLRALFEKDTHLGRDYHDDQVLLYCDYDRELLLSFLRKSTYYSLDKALALCQEQQLHEEVVFLLGR